MIRQNNKNIPLSFKEVRLYKHVNYHRSRDKTWQTDQDQPCGTKQTSAKQEIIEVGKFFELYTHVDCDIRRRLQVWLKFADSSYI